MHRSAHGTNFMVGEIKPCAQNAEPDLPILFAASHEYRRFRARYRQPEFTVSSCLVACLTVSCPPAAA
jgi:hypothetical protein